MRMLPVSYYTQLGQNNAANILPSAMSELECCQYLNQSCQNINAANILLYDCCQYLIQSCQNTLDILAIYASYQYII